MQQRIVGLDLGCARRASDEILGSLGKRRIPDVRNVGERRQRLTGGFLITQVHRDEPKVSPTRQFRFAPRNTDNIPARSEKRLNSGNPDEAACSRHQNLILHVFALPDFLLIFGSPALQMLREKTRSLRRVGTDIAPGCPDILPLWMSNETTSSRATQ